MTIYGWLLLWDSLKSYFSFGNILFSCSDFIHRLFIKSDCLYSQFGNGRHFLAPARKRIIALSCAYWPKQ